MNYVNIEKASCVDFSGWSVVLQVSGCEHKCEGCFVKNAGWWKHTTGKLFTKEVEAQLLSFIDRSYIDNFVLQGGDPLFKNNVYDIITLCKKIKTLLPNKNIVLFTGFSLKEITEDEQKQVILQYVDYIVDGKFDKNLTDRRLLFRGSQNQKVWKKENKGWVDVSSMYYTIK